MALPSEPALRKTWEETNARNEFCRDRRDGSRIDDTQSIDRTIRVTDGYCKVDGKWLIALEHISVPVDPATGKPDLASRL